MVSNQSHIYTFALNNPLIFTDPSGYRPEALFEEEERMERNSASGGFNYFGWIQNGTQYTQDYIASRSWHYSNGYHINFHTGAAEFAGEDYYNSAVKEFGGSFDSFTIYETGGSLDGGKTFIGNGHYGIIHEGIMVYTGLFPKFPNRAQPERYLESLISDKFLGNSKVSSVLSLADAICLDEIMNKLNVGAVGRNALRTAGPTAATVSVVFSSRAYRAGEISLGRLFADIGISVYSNVTGTIGDIAAYQYLLIDAFFPDGIEGFARDYSQVFYEYYDSVGSSPRSY